MGCTQRVRDVHKGIYMTSGSRLEKVDSLRSVGGFHGVWACSGVFEAPSYYYLGPPWQWGGRCPGQFLGRLLSEVLLGGVIFPRRAMRWMG
jgi:hypothetical protein